MSFFLRLQYGCGFSVRMMYNYILQYTFPFTCAAKMQFKKARVDVVEVVILEPFEEHVLLRILQEEEVLGKNVCCKI